MDALNKLSSSQVLSGLAVFVILTFTASSYIDSSRATSTYLVENNQVNSNPTVSHHVNYNPVIAACKEHADNGQNWQMVRAMGRDAYIESCAKATRALLDL